MADEPVQFPIPRDEPAVEPAAPVEPKPEFVAKSDYDTLLAKVGTLEGALTEAGKRLAVVDRVAEALVGKPAATLTKEEEAVRTELFRIMPELAHLKTVPQLKEAAQGAAQTAAKALTEAAYGYQLELQSQAGVPVDDQETNFYVGAAIKEWINQDNDRRSRFWRGDRTVIEEGFKKVQSKFLSTTRRATTKTTMETANARPKNSMPSGGTASGTEGPTVDFKDPKSVRAAFKAALAG